MPTRDQLEAATAIVEAARARLKGRLAIDYVVPDYYAKRPKACMGGWGRQFLNVTPAGKVLPCHAAETHPGPRLHLGARASRCAEIWQHSPGLQTVPRHGLDAGALPVLRPARDRLGRLPLPGLRAARRRRRHRPGLRAVARTMPCCRSP